MKKQTLSICVIRWRRVAPWRRSRLEPGRWRTGRGPGLKPNLENGRDVYEVCAACPQARRLGHADGTFPQLAGQHAGVAIKQLADIRALNRDNPTMYPFALPQSIGGPRSVADVSAYIQKLPMNPDNGKGEWAGRHAPSSPRGRS